MYKKLGFLILLSFLLLSAENLYAYRDLKELKVFKIDLIQEIFKNINNKIIYTSNGALDRNVLYEQGKESLWDISSQQNQFVLLIKGIVDLDQSLIDRGFISLEYGLNQRLKDGNFQDSSWSNTHEFIFSAFHSLAVLKQSRYEYNYVDKIQMTANNLTPSINWLKEEFYKNVLPDMERNDENFSSSLLSFTAANFKLGGIMTNDNILQEKARELIIKLIEKQRQDGVFPDRSGYDSFHQARTLKNMMIYLLYSNEEDLNKRILNSLTRGWEWQIPRIKSDGSMNVLGNSRTGLKFKRQIFVFDEINYSEVAVSLVYWSYISSNQSLLPVAKKVYHYGKSSNPANPHLFSVK